MSNNAKGTILTMKADKISLSGLAISLRRRLGGTVEDHTHLEGKFDFERVWNRAETASSLFAAQQEQLGLRLRASSGKVPAVVVDCIARPAAN
ncbi:MAG TPA: TIGR03435 family protein [Bryobacteraceae bacterium]|nr:TIGR03435 family protein [Bryobacteraceae bacterium]